MHIKKWQRWNKTLAFALAVAGFLAPQAGAQVQSSQLQFDLRTGADPFTFPPYRAVPIRIHTLFGAECQRWEMEVHSSSLTGGVTNCIGGLQATSQSATCMLDTGGAEGPKQIVAKCHTKNGTLERTQLVSVQAGVTPPSDSVPFGAPPVAGAPGVNASAAAPAAPAPAASTAAKAGGSSGTGTALAVGAVVLGTAAAVGLAAAAASGGGGSSGDSCPTASCSAGGGFCAWPASCACPPGSTGVGGACPANFGGTPAGTKHCLC